MNRFTFKYHADAKEAALSEVSLHIRAGQSVGILGGTGSAKTHAGSADSPAFMTPQKEW